MGHASAIEAALRLDETIGITDEQRRQVANLLAAAGWRPPARVVTTVAELDALTDGAVVLDTVGFVMMKQSRSRVVPGEECPYDPSATDLPATVVVEADH